MLCSVSKRHFLYVCYKSKLYQLQVFFLFFLLLQWIDLGSKNPLQLAHSGYQDAKIFGTKVWGGSLDFNLMCGIDAETTPVVCTSGLEIEFYPNLTPE